MRQNGKTTRIADFLIQQLFEYGEIKIKNHNGNKKGDYELFEIIKQRLKNEHRNLGYLKLQKENLTIKIFNTI